MHPVDALPDTDASPGLLITFILKQQACERDREAVKHMGQLISQTAGAHVRKVVI